MKDAELLRALLARDDLRDSEREAFADMLEQLECGEYKKLTEKQRAWVERMAGYAGDYQNLVSSGEISAESKVKLNLGPLPKRPPSRKEP